MGRGWAVTITLRPTVDSPDWYFTFGQGHGLERRYGHIHGTFMEARLEMIRRYGLRWCGQYPSADAAGVTEFGLVEIGGAAP